MGGMAFEYDEQKNQINIRKHGLSFKSAARVFFDYDRIEFYDDTHSDEAVSYTHLTLPTKRTRCRSRWSPYH